MKAKVDKDLCIGCGLCSALCPKVFHMNEDGVAEAIEEDVSGDLEADTEDARQQCPCDAITTDK